MAIAPRVFMDLDTRAEITIQDHVRYALGAGILPIPILDVALVTAVQLALIRDLAETYGVAHDVTESRTVLAALVGASVPRAGASAAKAIPGVGWWTGAVVQLALAGTSTYAVGQVFKRHFASARPARDLDPERVRFDYLRHVAAGRRDSPGRAASEAPAAAEGRRVEEPLQEPARRARPIRRVSRILRRLDRMREEGLIDESTFVSLRAQTLNAL